ncbi:BolA family protein [Cobetia sp. L2A1]|uniref:BolA family protein n=1 Tax=Cobetia sp. L2A1 TaxID=2686360 RepID=UPI00131A7399|nr:BolA/IbaG family iron-sulfur metabolism protein [Cobetia sp. L2A1]
MQPNDVKALLEARIENVDFHIQGEGCNFQVVAVGEVFADLSRVKAQQLVFAAINDEIRSGALHAISIRTYTPAQYDAAAGNAQG